MSEITGYLDRLTASPGERLQVMVSTAAAHFHADLIRLIHGDTNANGPGARFEPVASKLSGTYPGRVQRIAMGSLAVAPAKRSPRELQAFTIGAWVWPTRVHRDEPQGLVSRWFEMTGEGICFGLDRDGHLELRVGVRGLPPHAVRTEQPLRERAWQWVCASYDAGVATLLATCDEWPKQRLEARADFVAGAVELPDAPITLAACSATEDRGSWAGRGCFDGKLDAPFIIPAATVPFERLAEGHRPADALAAWAFEECMDTDRVVDRGPHGLHASLIQMPMRAATGHLWDGASDLRASGQYGAIHFHADDLEDARWEPDIEFDLPGELKSGVYAIRLTIDGDEDQIPVVVSASQPTPDSDVALLIPTVSYMAYANERMQDHPKLAEPGWLGLPIIPDRGDLALKRHPEYGASIYDRHADGSGICYSSWRRPIVNMRPDHRNWQTHAPRGLASDLYMVDWLKQQGTGYDVLSDHLLDAHGEKLLSPYRVLITGTHPEYWTAAMLDALSAWLDNGGRLMYLGGNGFYWVTSVDPARPHVVEVRRGIGGTRTWESSPGELRHSTTGELGGLWRYRGRDPNRLVGVGFAAQGFDERAAGYERRPASYEGRAAWVFEGIEEDVIGDFGLIMDGAAGDEIDRCDPAWGSPVHTVVLASSQGRHSNLVQLVIEDIPVTHPNIGGQQNPDVRADITFMETATGGAVFSVGSMSWNGSLSNSGYDNNVSRITSNVLRRFCDPTPFAAPAP